MRITSTNARIAGGSSKTEGTLCTSRVKGDGLRRDALCCVGRGRRDRGVAGRVWGLPVVVALNWAAGAGE
jgi:hypothetical protein